MKALKVNFASPSPQAKKGKGECGIIFIGGFAMIRNATRADLLNITHIYVDSWRRTYKNTLPADLLSALSYGGAEEKWESYLVKQEQGLFLSLIHI